MNELLFKELPQFSSLMEFINFPKHGASYELLRKEANVGAGLSAIDDLPFQLGETSYGEVHHYETLADTDRLQSWPARAVVADPHPDMSRPPMADLRCQGSAQICFKTRISIDHPFIKRQGLFLGRTEFHSGNH